MFFEKNKSFYPTNEALISKMISKIKGSPRKILEPHAGSGNIIEALTSHNYELKHSLYRISAIEKDENLANLLRGKGIRVIDDDFLSFSGQDKFDLIIANPPFDNGDSHLLKALDILYRGQIIFLLNAETIRNPYTNRRKDLLMKLDEHNAEIEFIKNGFVDAERKTNVEVALINIVIERKIEDDLFKDSTDSTEDIIIDQKEKHEVSNGKTIFELVAEYNQTIDIAVQTITGYFKNHKKISKYLVLVDSESKDVSCDRHYDMTTSMQNLLNDTLINIRKDFWSRVINIKEVYSRMTEKRRSEFQHLLEERSYMDFTENNIRNFILNIINSYEETIMSSVLDLFDRFTIESSFSGSLYEKNIHYYNGWKTNKAYKVGQKIVVSIFSRYQSAFFAYNSWTLSFEAERFLNDIDKVMNYFDGKKEYVSISDAIRKEFKNGNNTSIESTYFFATTYKKGTIHLVFKDKNVLRRFNIAACIGKKWLPDRYGFKNYSDMTEEEKSVVNSFDGKKTYESNMLKGLFVSPSQTMLIE